MARDTIITARVTHTTAERLRGAAAVTGRSVSSIVAELVAAAVSGSGARR